MAEDHAAAAIPSPSSVFEDLMPLAAMMAVQVVLAGVNILYKLAISDGMATSVLVAYRCIFGAAVLCPVAYFLKRKKRPQMTWTVLFHGFLSGLFGGMLVQNLYVSGINLTSVTFATAINNLGPVVTFALSVTFRIEKVGIGSAAGYLKVGGTAVAVGGAMLLTFYKGSELHLWSSPVNLLDNFRTVGTGRTAAKGSPVLGTLLCLGSCLSYASWLILQAKIGHHYPCPYSSTALMSAMGSAQAVAYALWAERRDWKAWRLGFNVRLLAVMYNGLVGSALAVTVLSWVVNKKGPLYVSMFMPLILVIVAILGSLLLGETLHVGTVMGSVLIVAGLYLVLWGKRREAEAAKFAEKEKLPATTTSSGIESSARHYSAVTDSIHLEAADSILQPRLQEETAVARGGSSRADQERPQRHSSGC